MIRSETMEWLLVMLVVAVAGRAAQRQGRAYSEFQPPVVRPQQEQVYTWNSSCWYSLFP